MLLLMILSSVPDGIMVFWGYTGITRVSRLAPPAGWVIDSSFVGRFPRGCPGDSVGTKGGSSTHKHTRIYGSTGGGTGTDPRGQPGPGTLAAIVGHTHPLWASGTISTTSHIPPYRDFLVIRKVGEDVGLPAGTVMMFTEEPPSGWRVILVDSFPRGSLSLWGKGGSPTHYHTFSGYTGDPYPTSFEPGSATASGCHGHPVSGSTAPESNLPPYVRVVFAQLETWTEDIPVGAVGMFDSPPSGSPGIGVWESFDTLNTGRRFPLGCNPSNALMAGGSSSHVHGISSITIGPSGGGAGVENVGGGAAGTPHTHEAYPTRTDTAFALPPYRYTMFWQKTGVNTAMAGNEQGETGSWAAIGLRGAISIKAPPGILVKIYDITGKRVFACDTGEEEMLVKGLGPGVLFVRMESADLAIVKKVIVR